MFWGVVLADDQDASAEMLLRILNAISNCRVLAQARNGRDAVAAVSAHRPEVLLLDISMPVMNGLEAARQVKAQFPDTRILFVTGQLGSAYVRAAFNAGASAYVDKAQAFSDLPVAIHRVLAGETFLSNSLQS